MTTKNGFTEISADALAILKTLTSLDRLKVDEDTKRHLREWLALNVELEEQSFAVECIINALHYTPDIITRGDSWRAIIEYGS